MSDTVLNLVKDLVIAGNKWSKNIGHITEIEDLFSYQVDHNIAVTDFLSKDANAKAIVKDILNSEGNKLIIAHMGIGKSTSVISLGASQKLKIIFAVPLIVNVDQFFAIHKKEKGVNRIRKQNAQAMSKILDNEDNKVIICTYDRVEKISAYLERWGDTNKWILVMDEAHNLVSQSNYREKALRKFLFYSGYYSKLILLTGTPDVLMYPLSKCKIDFAVYEFRKAISTFNKGSFKTLYTEYLDPTAILLMNLLSEEGKVKKGLRIIVQENISRLNELRSLLIEHGLATDKEIFILNSKAKDSESWGILVENSIIKPGVKYFLSTSVISDGCNIENTNVIEFYSINWVDLTKLRQMQSRLRNASNDLKYYDIIRLSEPLFPEIPNGFIDIDEIHQIEKQLRDALCNIISMYSNSSYYGDEFESFFKDKSVYGINNRVRTDIFALYQELSNRFIYSPLSSFPDLRHEFIKRFFKIDPTKVELEYVKHVDKNISKNLYDKRKIILEKKYDELLAELESSHKKV
ncbi:MAG TPA: DEAD/DEAH box helicase family protein, partial [Ignavibacteriaceae bacterium]|nr:DEAD/DEAH box helicase family protein [Ignavibacteriaceae bacterium]